MKSLFAISLFPAVTFSCVGPFTCENSSIALFRGQEALDADFRPRFPGLWARFSPFHQAAASPAAATARSVTVRITLWARANHRAMALTLAKPRTRNCYKPRLRAMALTHSAVAARSL
jgi:hypothetical protein